MSFSFSESAENLKEYRQGKAPLNATNRKLLFFPFKLTYYCLALSIYLVFVVLLFPFVKSLSRAGQLAGFMFPARLR